MVISFWGRTNTPASQTPMIDASTIWDACACSRVLPTKGVPAAAASAITKSSICPITCAIASPAIILRASDWPIISSRARTCVQPACSKICTAGSPLASEMMGMFFDTRRTVYTSDVFVVSEPVATINAACSTRISLNVSGSSSSPATVLIPWSRRSIASSISATSTA